MKNRYWVALLLAVSTGACGEPADTDGIAVDGLDDIDTANDDDGSAADTTQVEVRECIASGAGCALDGECCSGACLRVGTHGLCATSCTIAGTCSDMAQTCAMLAEGVEVCVPNGACVDLDDDGFGEGSGCFAADCDDEDATAHTGANELCDGLDNDCDGEVDEGLMRNPCGGCLPLSSAPGAPCAQD